MIYADVVTVNAMTTAPMKLLEVTVSDKFSSVFEIVSPT